jgi:hypothetical protein
MTDAMIEGGACGMPRRAGGTPMGKVPVRRPRPRFTIGRMMGWVALSALVAACVTQPVVMRVALIASLAVVTFVLAPFFLVRDVILPLTKGVRCPGCGAWALQRVGVVSFGARYFRCASCEARFKRDAIGPWRTADEPDDVARYGPKDRGDPWDFEPFPEDDERHGWKTIDSLVSNQRRRKSPR